MSDITYVQTTLADSVAERMEIICDGYACNSSVSDAVGSAADFYMHVLEDLAALRYYFAMSGAMRWPWSQEAAIYLRGPVVA